MADEIVRQRLAAQHICGDHSFTPLETVESMGAFQAQDYPSALWAIGLRTKSSTLGSVEKSISDRVIVRSPLLRNTIHMVPAADYRWMLALVAKRMRSAIHGIARSNGVRLIDDTIENGHRIIAEALAGGPLTRPELYGVLRERGILIDSFAGLLMVQLAQADGLICFGPRKGAKQFLALLDDWIPNADVLPPAEALARLSLRYFKGHGPATLDDFAWWSGLTKTQARLGLSSVQSQLDSLMVGEMTYWSADARRSDECPGTGIWLLPSFDEYTVGYRDRTPIFGPDLESQKPAQQARIALANVIVANGKIVGSWKRIVVKQTMHITAMPFRPISSSDRKLLKAAMERYGAFMGRSAELVIKG